jgi:hypothetical protein
MAKGFRYSLMGAVNVVISGSIVRGWAVGIKCGGGMYQSVGVKIGAGTTLMAPSDPG